MELLGFILYILAGFFITKLLIKTIGKCELSVYILTTLLWPIALLIYFCVNAGYEETILKAYEGEDYEEPGEE